MRADLGGNYIQSKLLLSLKHVDKTKPYYQSIQLYNYIVWTETDKVQLLKLFILSSATCVLRGWTPELDTSSSVDLENCHKQWNNMFLR